MNRITVAFGVFYGAGFELAISGIILTLFFGNAGFYLESAYITLALCLFVELSGF
jgi:hypothetical protein